MNDAWSYFADLRRAVATPEQLRSLATALPELAPDDVVPRDSFARRLRELATPPTVTPLFVDDVDPIAVSNQYPHRHLVSDDASLAELQRVIESYLREMLGEVDARELDRIAAAFGAGENSRMSAPSLRTLVTTVLVRVCGPAPLTDGELLRFMTVAGRCVGLALRQRATAELARRAAARQTLRVGNLPPSLDPTHAGEPMGFLLAMRHPRHALARLDALEQSLSDTPERSASRRLHFVLYELAGCTESEIVAHCGYTEQPKLRQELNTDLLRAREIVYGKACEAVGREQ